MARTGLGSVGPRVAFEYRDITENVTFILFRFLQVSFFGAMAEKHSYVILQNASFGGLSGIKRNGNAFQLHLTQERDGFPEIQRTYSLEFRMIKRKKNPFKDIFRLT